MSPDEFEKHLQRQPLRKVPDEWRAEILRIAESSHPSTPDPRPSFLSTINHHLSTLLWPHPKAWAGLAAVWILIFSLHVTSRDSVPRLADNAHAPTAEIVLNFRDQEKILAELIDNNEMPAADRPKRLPAQPHSERRETTARA